MRDSARRTTEPGYVNRRGQTVLRKTAELGNDHNQRVYVFKCGDYAHEYGANGSDIFQRRCPRVPRWGGRVSLTDGAFNVMSIKSATRRSYQLPQCYLGQGRR